MKLIELKRELKALLEKYDATISIVVIYILAYLKTIPILRSPHS